MIEIKKPEINVDEIMEKIREEVARRKSQTNDRNIQSSMVGAPGKIPLSSGIEKLKQLSFFRYPEEKPLEQRQSYSLSEFLDYHKEGNFKAMTKERLGSLGSLIGSRRSINGKIIRIGLKYKHLIKKIPLVNIIARNFYHSLAYKSIPENPNFTAKKMGRIIREIPLLGYLIWWIYMVIKAPTKIGQIFSEVNGLKRKGEVLEIQINQLSSEVNGLKRKGEVLEIQINQLSSEVNRTRNGFKKVGSEWSEFYSKEITNEDMIGNIEHHRYFIELIIDWANKHCSNNNVPRLVEIGVGTATISIYLSKRNFEIVGFDSDPLIIAKAIETNKKFGGHAKFIAIDAFDLPRFLKENAFDIAFSQGTMEHFNNDNLKRLLEAQLAVARYVVFSIPSINYPYADFGNERKMTVEEWQRLLKDFGFKMEHISYYSEGNWEIAIVVGDDVKMATNSP